MGDKARKIRSRDGEGLTVEILSRGEDSFKKAVKIQAVSPEGNFIFVQGPDSPTTSTLFPFPNTVIILLWVDGANLTPLASSRVVR